MWGAQHKTPFSYFGIIFFEHLTKVLISLDHELTTPSRNLLTALGLAVKGKAKASRMIKALVLHCVKDVSTKTTSFKKEMTHFSWALQDLSEVFLAKQ